MGGGEARRAEAWRPEEAEPRSVGVERVLAMTRTGERRVLLGGRGGADCGRGGAIGEELKGRAGRDKRGWHLGVTEEGRGQA